MDLAIRTSYGSAERIKVGAAVTDGTEWRFGYNYKNSDGTITHAEEAALSKASHLRNSTLYVTLSPCMECALKIIEHGGVTKVVYDAFYPSPVYRCKEALELLKNHGIETCLK